MLYKNEIKQILPCDVPKFSEKEGLRHLSAAKIEDLEKSGKVLVVDFYYKTNMQVNCRFFTDGKSYQIYYPIEDSWNTRLLNRYGDARAATSPDTRKLINEFLKDSPKYYCSEYCKADQIIDSFISASMGKKRDKAVARKQERIDRHMEMFPDYPDDLKGFCRQRVFMKYIFFSSIVKNKRNAVCSLCGEEFTVEKAVKHKTFGNCPKCGTRAQYYSDWLTSSIKEKESICIAHKVEGNLIIRGTNATVEYIKNEAALRFEDQWRTLYLSDEKAKIYSYNNNFVYPYGAYWHETKWSNRNSGYLYPNNLKEVFGEKYYNIDMQKEFSKIEQPVKFIPLLDNLKNIPQTEYLVKLGLNRLASEIEATNLQEGSDFASILGISKQYLPLYRHYNVSLFEHEIIKTSKTWVSIEDFAKYRELKIELHSPDLICKLLEDMSFTKFVNYFTKMRGLYPKEEMRQIINWYKDYIEMNKELKVDIKRKAVRYPNDIKDAHDRILIRFSEVKNVTENEKFKIAIKNLYAGLREYSKGDYAIVLPTCKEDFIREGQSLSHCVGAISSYFNNHMEGSKMIFFIRKKDDIDTPFVTMEIDMRRHAILQLYGFGDKAPAAEVKNFAKGFLNKLSKRETTKEMESAM